MIARISLLAMIGILIAGPWFCADPVAQDRAMASSAPGVQHWLGTDDYGRDLAARFLYGGRWSVIAGAAATLLALAAGWILGGAAGFMGGRADQLVMLISEWFLALPWIYLLIAARAALPLDLPSRDAMLAVILLIALVSWARPARLARGMVLSLSRKGYVESARGFGVPGWKIFARHILPGTGPVFLAQTLTLLPRFVLAEVTLSFLGLGVSEPNPTWGALIVPLKQVYLLEQQWWKVIPMMLMIPFFVNFALVARQFESRFRNAR